LPSAPPTPRARYALIVSLWGLFVSNVTLTILVIALPVIAADLRAPLASTNWVSLAPLLAVAAFTPLAGTAADRYGAKRIWLLGFVLTLTGIGASALAPSLPSLVAARFATGVGGALFVPAALAITSAAYPPSERAIPIGYWTSAVAISPLVGVLVGGYLTELLGWRTLFHAQLAIGLPALVAGLRLPEQEIAARGAFDIAGALTAALAGAALLLACSWLGTMPLAALAPVLVAVLATLGLVRIERRAVNPVFPPALLAQAGVQHALLARFAISFTYMGSFMTLPYLLSSLWGLSTAAVALTLALRPLAMGIAGPLAGRLAVRFGTAQLTIAGSWLMLLACLVFALLSGEQSALDQALLSVGLVGAGLGLGIGSPGTVSAVSTRVPVSELGTVSALMTLTSTLANALGMAGMFALVELTGGVHLASAYRWSNLGGALVASLGLVAAHALRRNDRATNHA
jgi:DHA2 family methylenomycin A resistance protein-like MFS transporter